MTQLAVQNLTYRHGPEVALTFPSFEVGKGEQLALIGPSGAGKTTLLHLIAGLLRPESGQIRFDGQIISALSESGRDAYRARSVGYVFQDFHLMPGYSALENVLLGLGLSGMRGPQARERAAEVLSELGLGARLRHTPRQLSTGERQRVALARAVAHRPALLLADEPTAHLDRARGVQALKLLQDTAAVLGVTLIVVTHDPLVMDAFGRLIEVGAVAPHRSPEQTLVLA
ncbi:ABC transporter ATP-binding protein [Deinococcus psychrotolerans]|uniref:ABC transporter ATP-binding protein n=1 Tax=Deinococcus psychrotolerans TaxID=2489213 RepID=A0A3G8YA07_9DEIO|nr:ABC transporter ATP-binding protein [Deinococcus psychrotolerans]AZI41985.1 ABC transporter ATP-binding protein [Deinococcus psychrotolerans]